MDKYYNDNLNDKYRSLLDEYSKYIKMYYSVAKTKDILEKRMDGDRYILKGKGWDVLLTPPRIINLYGRYTELSKEYNNSVVKLKDKLYIGSRNPAYNSSANVDIDRITGDINGKWREMESIRGIFDRQREDINVVLIERKEILKSLAEIEIKRRELYGRVLLSGINGEMKERLKEIYMNEGLPKELRVKQIAKNMGLRDIDVGNWLEWLRSVENYVKKTKELSDNVKIFKMKNDKYTGINENFLIEPPIINKSGSKRGDVIGVDVEGDNGNKGIVKRRTPKRTPKRESMLSGRRDVDKEDK